MGEPEVLSAPAALDARLRMVGRRRVVFVHGVELEDRVRHAAAAEVAPATESLPELDESGVSDALLLGVGEVALSHARPPGDECRKEAISHVRAPANPGCSFEDVRSHGRPVRSLDDSRSERPHYVNASQCGRISINDEAGCRREGAGIARSVAPGARNELLACYEPAGPPASRSDRPRGPPGLLSGASRRHGIAW